MCRDAATKMPRACLHTSEWKSDDSQPSIEPASLERRSDFIVVAEERHVNVVRSIVKKETQINVSTQFKGSLRKLANA